MRWPWKDRRLLLATSCTFTPFDGDVSQSAGVSAFGLLGEGAFIYRDLANDTPADIDAPIPDIGDSIPVASAPVISGRSANVGFDIRLVNEFLWFADPLSNRALLTEFPCGYGRKLPERQYAVV